MNNKLHGGMKVYDMFKNKKIALFLGDNIYQCDENRKIGLFRLWKVFYVILSGSNFIV